jgi:two-component system cell cycle response regulator
MAASGRKTGARRAAGGRILEELKRANRRLIAQQRSVIEEERLKVLLKMAGATAHELNQPLTALLGGIELLRSGAPAGDAELARLEAAARRIAEVVEQIQALRMDPVRVPDAAAAVFHPRGEIRVLSVEDSEADFLRLKACLDQIGNIRVRRAADPAAAYRAIGEEPFDLILLDYVLPGATALDVMGRLQAQNIGVPVVIFTGQGDEIIASRTIQAGAYDYLPKFQLSAEALAKAIHNTLEKHRLRQEVEAMTRRLSEMAIRDELTGLYNKRFFSEAIDREIDRAARYGQKLSLAMADVDHFKRVNDGFGHAAGDYVLRRVGGTILNSTRKSDIPCRFGGEEFAVILPDIGLEQAVVFGERLRRQVGAVSFEAEGIPLRVTLSLGIAQYDPARRMRPEDLVQAADERLYQAKRAGRDRVVTAAPAA